jgi:mRNA interferase MazF
MITTRRHDPWPGDAAIESPDAAGLRAPSIVRLKLFTLDNRLIVRVIGHLSEADRESAAEQIRLHLV